MVRSYPLEFSMLNEACVPYPYSANLRSEVSFFLPEGYSRVLEIGCSDGAFRKNLLASHEYWGVEPNHRAAAAAGHSLDKVLTGFYNEVADKLPDHYFDLVICNDVIEHMADPDSFLEAIKAKMTANASLVGSIPNVRHISNLKSLLIGKDWQYEDAGILDRTHLKFFTEKSLRSLFAAHQFEVEQLSGMNDISSRGFFRACSQSCFTWCWGMISVISNWALVSNSSPMV